MKTVGDTRPGTITGYEKATESQSPDRVPDTDGGASTPVTLETPKSPKVGTYFEIVRTQKPVDYSNLQRGIIKLLAEKP